MTYLFEAAAQRRKPAQLAARALSVPIDSGAAITRAMLNEAMASASGGNDAAGLWTQRDPHVRSVIEAAIAAGRYICELDPARAAARDQSIRSQAAARAGETAADLIPAIRDGLVLADSRGGGQRFIQPILSDGRKLDELAGQGWRLFVRDTGPQGAIAAGQLPDDGAVVAWLDVHDAEAVLVRPDHYVFGTGHPAKLLAARAEMLGMSEDVAA